MKTIIFDFDGTLTYNSPNIWKAIWQKLGYNTDSDSLYAQLYASFVNNSISYQRWCDLTCEAYIKGGMNDNILKDLSNNIRLIKGAEFVFQTLKSKGCSLHIVSGCIASAIRNVLGDNVKYFDSINGSEFQFDDKGLLIYIKGTKYDFEGKAKFVTEHIARTGTSPRDIYFVGNSDNDEWVHLSGCNTLCINPDNIDEKNTTKWHKIICDVSDLRQILDEFDVKKA